MSSIESRIASRASRFVASPLVGYRVIPSRLIALAVAIGAATPAAAPADPLNILPAATADAARTARFETVPVRYASAQGPNYGGGFLEFLMTRGGGPVQRPGQGYAPMAPEPDARRAAVDPRYDRQVVPYDGVEKPGTVVIDTPDRLLYLVEPGGKAVRYGIGVGRPGFTWAGVKYVSQKREWPDWRPPDEMLHRRPDLPHFMSGGPENPLGARALYLGSSLYRIHGSNEPWTIGTQVSSGCIRMRNEDVIDLYGRVPVGAKVVVI